VCGPAAAASSRYEHMHTHQLTNHQRRRHLRPIPGLHGLAHRVYSHPHVQPDLESPYREPVGVSLDVTECISLGVTECFSHSHCYADLLPHSGHPVSIIHPDHRSDHFVAHALSILSRANRGTCIMRAAQHACVLRLTPPSCALLLHQLTPNTLTVTEDGV
jgi:LmbE family N-acetylglucosaminyl deacetylase